MSCFVDAEDEAPPHVDFYSNESQEFWEKINPGREVYRKKVS